MAYPLTKLHHWYTFPKPLNVRGITRFLLNFDQVLIPAVRRSYQDRCEVLFFLNRESHALQIWPTPKTCVQFSNCTSLETLRPCQVVETVLRHASVGVRYEMVRSATILRRSTASERSLESSQLAKFECAISPGYDVRQKSYGFR